MVFVLTSENNFSGILSQGKCVGGCFVVVGWFFLGGGGDWRFGGFLEGGINKTSEPQNLKVSLVYYFTCSSCSSFTHSLFAVLRVCCFHNIFFEGKLH